MRFHLSIISYQCWRRQICDHDRRDISFAVFVLLILEVPIRKCVLISNFRMIDVPVANDVCIDLASRDAFGHSAFCNLKVERVKRHAEPAVRLAAKPAKEPAR